MNSNSDKTRENIYILSGSDAWDEQASSFMEYNRKLIEKSRKKERYSKYFGKKIDIGTLVVRNLYAISIHTTNIESTYFFT